MKIRFELLDELKKLVDECEWIAPRIKDSPNFSKGQQTIYRTAKGLLIALEQEKKRNPALFESKKELSAEIEQYLKFFVGEYQELQKISRQICHQDENACNYGLTKRQETRTENLERKAQEIAERLGFNFYHQGDPRGLTGWLLPPDIQEKDGFVDYLSGIPIYF